MKVIVSRSGGITGIRVTWQVRVELQPDAAWWQTLIAGLPWDEIQDSEPQPDRYVYLIKCAPHEVVLGEPEVQGPWRELVERVKEVNDREPVSGRERRGEYDPGSEDKTISEHKARTEREASIEREADSAVTPPSGKPE